MGRGVATELVVEILKSLPKVRFPTVTPDRLAVGLGALPVAATCVPTSDAVVPPVETANLIFERVPANRPVIVAETVNEPKLETLVTPLATVTNGALHRLW